MKRFALFVALVCAPTVRAAEPPEIFEGLFTKDVPVQAEIGMVLPPPDIDKYIAKVSAAARKDVKWYREYSKNAKPGVPLPYDERLGLTKDEYAEYLALWNQRKFQPMGKPVSLLLRQNSDKTWSIVATGDASPVSTLRYDPAEDLFRSPNGRLQRIGDVNADASTILGAWTGREWKFEEETSLGRVKENVAFGRFADNTYGLIVYRMQELSTEGTRLIDKGLVVRFPLGKAGKAKATADPAKATKTR